MTKKNKVSKVLAGMWLLLGTMILGTMLVSVPSYAGVPTTTSPCPTPTPMPSPNISDSEPDNVSTGIFDWANRIGYLIEANALSVAQVLPEALTMAGNEIQDIKDVITEMWPVLLIVFAVIIIALLLSLLAGPEGPAVVLWIVNAMGLAFAAWEIGAKVGDAIANFLAGTRQAWFSDGDTPTIQGASTKIAKAKAGILMAVVLGLITYATNNPELFAAKLRGAFQSIAGPEKTEEIIAKILKVAKTGCFVAGTPVMMADGSWKAIEYVKVGDRVMSKNISAGKIEGKKVTHTSVRHNISTLVIAFQDGSTVETTDEHPFYVDGVGFTKAGEVGIGSSIVTRAGPSLLVSEVKKNVHVTTVYNVTVADNHTYFVGKPAVLVHNATLCEQLARYKAMIAALRAEYEAEVRALAGVADQMAQEGKSPEEIARTVHALRRQLGVKYKNLTPQWILDQITERNLGVYVDPLGPTIEKLIEKGKTWDQIIQSASSPGNTFQIDWDKIPPEVLENF